MAASGVGQDATAPDSTVAPSKEVKDGEYGSNVLARLDEFRQEGLFTDAVLCVEEEEFPCHKNVLAVSSPYFQAMFTSDLRESREARIVFNEISAPTLKRLIDYAYSGRVEVTASNAQELLAAACLFQYPAIVASCEDFLELQLHSSNCLNMEIFAQLHSCYRLQESARQHALENFTAVAEGEEFVHLCPERLSDYLGSDLIDVRTEETVFHAMLKWVRHDLDKRDQFLPELLSKIRLAVLDTASLDAVEQEPLVSHSAACCDLVNEARLLKQAFHQTDAGKRRRSMQDSAVQPRPSTVAKEVLVVIASSVEAGTTEERCASVSMFDPHKERWLPLQDFPGPAVLWSSVAVLHNNIYVVGGISHRGHITDKVWRFDSRQRTWAPVSPMLKPRARHSAAILDDKMYVFGGVRYERKLLRVETIECYNPASNTWSPAGRTMFPRQEACSVPFNNSIVEVGGLQGEEAVVKTMDSYHVVGDAIRPTGEQIVLPEPIQFGKIVVIAGVFYIIWEDSGKLIALNAKKRTFADLPVCRHPRKHCGVAVLNGKIYIAGGIVDGKPTSLVESFDPMTKVWSVEKSLPESRDIHGCVTVKMC